MARFVATIHAPRAIETAFDYLADFSSVAEWDPSVVQAQRLGSHSGPEAEFRVVVRFAGRQVPLTYVITDYRRPERLVLRSEARGSSPRTRSPSLPWMEGPS